MIRTELRRVVCVMLFAVVPSHGCYSPNLQDCNITCASDQQCPQGFSCSATGVCRANGVRLSCAELGIDAPKPKLDASTQDGRVSVDARMPDSVSAQCRGTPVACSTHQDRNTCNAQDGCGFVTTSCVNEADCAQYTTNLRCSQDPACTTDFATSTCVRKAGVCQGSTKAACEANAVCSFRGGCGGNPAACSAYSAEASCRAHTGCSWQ